ncbi:MAG: beta strand repeat-containing protein, partial [Solirubrobacteraceae bacterium]
MYDSIAVGQTTVALSLPGGPYLQIAGTGVTLTVLGQTLAGDLTFQEATLNGARVVTVTVANGQLTLGSLPTIDFTGGLVLANGGIAGILTVSAPSLTIGSVTLSGGLQLQINTTSVPETVPTGGTPATIVLPAGPYLQLGSSTPLSLTIGDVTVAGSFTVQQTSSTSGQSQTLLGVSGATVTAGSLTLLKDGQGLLAILPAGIAGDLSGTIDTGSLIPNVTFAGTFGLQINETGGQVSESLTVGGQTQTLDLAAGTYVEVSGTGVTLTIGGQSLSGNFSFEHSDQGDTLTASDVSLSLGTGSTSFVTLSDGQGQFTVDGSTSATPGLFGTLSGTVKVNVPGVAVGGTFTLTVNTTNAAQGDIPTGPTYVAVTGTGVSLTVLSQTLSGDFAFSDANGTITLTITKLNMFVGSPGSLGLSITQSTTPPQSATLTISSAGVSGDIQASVAFIGLPSDFNFGPDPIPIDVAFSPGSLLVQVGTLADPGTGTLAAPITINVLGQTLTGVFSFQSTTEAGKTVIAIAAQDVGLSLGSGGDGVTLTGGSAMLLITPEGVAGQIGCAAGDGSNCLTVTLPGVVASVGSFSVTLNTLLSGSTPQQVDQTFTIGGTTQTLTLPAGHYIDVAVTGAGLAIAGQTLKADLTVSDSANLNSDGTLATGAGAGDTIVITLANGSLSLGTGTRTLVSVSDASGSLTISSDPAHEGVYGTLTATITTQIPDVTFGGTFTVSINTTGAAQDSGTIPTGLVVSGSGITLGVLGQTLTANVTFGHDSDTGTTYLAVTDLTLSLGNGSTTFVTATVASGAVVLTPTGVAAEFTDATVSLGWALTGDGLILSGSVSLAFSNDSTQAIDDTFDVGTPTGTTPVTINVP